MPDSKLLHNLFQKRDLLRAGDERHREIRTALLLCGGGPGLGAVGAGCACGFFSVGLAECFDYVFGVSAGAGTAAFCLAGWKQARIGITIFIEECTTRRYFNPFRSPMVDTDFIESVLRRGPKALDVAAVCRSRSEFYVAVTDANTGEFLMVDAKRALPDLVTAVKASIAVPGLDGRPVTLNGREVIDGGLHPLPLKRIIAELQPTDLLIVPNCTRSAWENAAPTILERAVGRILLQKHPPPVRRAIRERFQHFHEERRCLEELDGVNVGILFAPYDVKPFGYDSRRFRLAADAATDATRKLLTAAERRYRQ